MDKTFMSFYCDDTHPYSAPVEAFEAFIRFVTSEGIAGESSVILGARWAEHGLLSEPATNDQRRFVELLHRSYDYGLDAHMELFTHGGLFNFDRREVPDGVIHEGLWLHTASYPVEEYEAYFDAVIREGEKIGMPFTGLTWPGCSCNACMSVYRVLDEKGLNVINPNVYHALLNLAKKGRFRGNTVPCFISEEREGCQHCLMAGDGRFGVYDLPPNVGDRFAMTRDGERVPADPDYYISADGQSGAIVDSVRAGDPYCIFYTHWWTINPHNGPGWPVFATVIKRIREHLADQIIWMRPSEITALFHERHIAESDII